MSPCAEGRGVSRSKRRAMGWLHKAAEKGHYMACFKLAGCMYANLPYSREVGIVEEAARVATSAGVFGSHDVPLDILNNLLYWLRKGSMTDPSNRDPLAMLDLFRRQALDGAKHCRNDGCEVVGHYKDFKVCPQCKTARYCSAACQTHDWTTGGHKETCGQFRIDAHCQHT